MASTRQKGLQIHSGIAATPGALLGCVGVGHSCARRHRMGMDGLYQRKIDRNQQHRKIPRLVYVACALLPRSSESEGSSSPQVGVM
jgi:hypothetical protein